MLLLEVGACVVDVVYVFVILVGCVEVLVMLVGVVVRLLMMGPMRRRVIIWSVRCGEYGREDG